MQGAIVRVYALTEIGESLVYESAPMASIAAGAQRVAEVLGRGPSRWKVTVQGTQPGGTHAVIIGQVGIVAVCFGHEPGGSSSSDAGPVGYGDVVYVNGAGSGGAYASPYTARAGQTVVCGCNAGAVTVIVPPLALGHGVRVKCDDAHPPNADNALTIERQDGGNIAQPAPNNGTFAAQIQQNAAGDAGSSLLVWNGGSSGGYLVD